MGLNNAEYVDGLSPSDPRYEDKVRHGASHIRAIKNALLQTFPSITGPVTEGPDGLNGFEARIAALEANPATIVPMARGSATGSGAGTFVITDLDFTPSVIMVLCYTTDGSDSAALSFGFADGTNEYNAGVIANTGPSTSAYVGASQLGSILDYVSSTSVVFTSFEADGFTLTLGGSGTVGAAIQWMAWE